MTVMPDPGSAGFLDFEELRAFLGAATSDPTAVYAVGMAACELVESQVGPVLTQTITERTTSHGGYVPLQYQPTALSASSSGAVDSWTIEAFAARGDAPSGPVTVTYTTGDSLAPHWAMTAAKIIARHLWLTQLGRGATNAPREAAMPGAGFTIPNQAAAFLEPHRLGPRIG